MKEVTIEVAKRYLASGLAVLPASKAEKRPLVGAWKTYRKRPPTTAELESWFAQAPDALCLVTGGVSGNLECIDFDHHAELYDHWKSRLDPAVLNSLVIERTQSSGIHAFYRCEEAVEGNMKLARGIRDGKSATLKLKPPEFDFLMVEKSAAIKLATANLMATEARPEKDSDDPIGLLVKVDENDLATKPTVKSGESVGALPVKAVKGLWYQASWGNGLQSMTQGEKVQAMSERLYLGVIKQTGASGFYRLSVSEK